jgi:hypothetical protein
MKGAIVTELSRCLEPVTHDPFVSDLPGSSARPRQACRSRETATLSPSAPRVTRGSDGGHTGATARAQRAPISGSPPR